MVDQDQNDETNRTRLTPAGDLPRQVAHFEVRGKLGAGGMGEVFRAFDPRLHRELALKLLPEQVADDSETRSRFLREAQTAASLNHPNIITIYEIGEFQGRQFIAMELVEGESLKQLLQSRKLSVTEACEIAIQICDGLSAAHEAGIIHRDIKPANIVVNRRRQVKILDFGLAKFQSISNLTSTGVRLGTIAYMSPEQARGEELDQQSDIFSLGVMLYEMLGGVSPFKRENEVGTLMAIINDPPPVVTQSAPAVSAELAGVVNKALEKRKSDRFQNANEFGNALRTLLHQPLVATATDSSLDVTAAVSIPIADNSSLSAVTRTAVSVRKPVVILPFENLGAADQGYFAEGITDEITTALAKLRELKVISNSSARHFNLREFSPERIGRELSVSYILSGTIRWDTSREPSQFRLSCKLIDTKDESYLWAETYDRVLDQIFTLQSELAGEIAKALGFALGESDISELGVRPTNNLESFDYYLRGNEFFPKSTSAEDIEKAIVMYEQAVALDPKFAIAYARASRAHSTMYWFFHDRTPERIARAEVAVEKARQLAPDHEETHLALGYFYYYARNDYTQALQFFALARTAQPNNSSLLAATAFIQRRIGRWNDAERNLQKASDLDPRSALLAYEMGNTAMLMRKYTVAVGNFARATMLVPDWIDAYARHAISILLDTGEVSAAAEVFRDVQSKFDPAEMVIEWILLDPFVEYCSGDPNRAMEKLFIDDTEMELYFINKGRLSLRTGAIEEARGFFGSARVLLESKVRNYPDDARYHSHLGVALAGLGEKERALESGARAVEIMPFMRDQVFGCTYLETLTLICVMVGELDRAIEHLRFLLSVPSMISIELLKVGTDFAPVRAHPGFAELISKYEME